MITEFGLLFNCYLLCCLYYVNSIFQLYSTQMTKINIILLTILLSSCSAYIKKIPASKTTSLSNRVTMSDAHRNARKSESETFSLAEKELYFLQRLQKKFIVKPEFLVKRYNLKDHSDISVYVDESSLYLSYLSLKAKGLNFSDGYKKAAHKIIDGIYYLDGLNTLDGYLPRFATLKEDKFIIGEEPIRTNSYSLLFFGYYMAYHTFEDVVLRNKITSHVELIIKHFISNNLVLADQNGQKIKYSDLKSNNNLSRKLDALVIFEIANIIIKDKNLKKEIAATLAYFKQKGYMKPNQIMKLSIGNWDLASSSSHWLNMMKIYILSKATNNYAYNTMFKNLYTKLDDSQNTLFTLLYGDVFPITTKDLEDTIIALQTFPLSLNNQEIINSKRTDITLKKYPKIIKNKRTTESLTPLAIFDRPLVYFEWKRNQYRVDGNFLADGNVEFSGLDYLLAYALLPMQKIAVEKN